MKYYKALNVFDGHKPAFDEIWNKIPEKLKNRLTANDLAVIATLMNQSYHLGKTSTKAEKLDNEAVYVDGVGIVEFDKCSE